MRLSARLKYVVVAMLELALQYPKQFVSVAHLAEKHGISCPFLEKLLLQLKQSGLTMSRRGPDGGYRLSVPPEKIRIGDIFEAVEGPVSFAKSFVASSQCEATNHCMAGLLQELEAGISDVLNEKTLHELCSQARRFRRLSQPAHTISFSI